MRNEGHAWGWPAGLTLRRQRLLDLRQVAVALDAIGGDILVSLAEMIAQPERAPGPADT